MEKYIGTKMVEAEKATRETGEEGYRIRYSDGYVSWSPKEVFEKAYLPVSINQNLRTEAPSISQEMVDNFIDHTEVITMGDKTTVVRAVLKNGFEIKANRKNYYDDNDAYLMVLGVK